MSGRRRRIGALIFALLVGGAYAYWSLTNETRIQRKVEEYLTRVTGGTVRVRRASFRLFTGIRVEGLRVFLGDDRDTPFFQGDIVLDHRPWGLVRGRLEPTEIVCVNAGVTLIYDHSTGRWNAQLIFPLRGESGGPLVGGAALLAIRLRGGCLDRIELLDGRPLRHPRLPLNVALVPADDGKTYHITIEDQEGTIRQSGTIDAATGRVALSGPVWPEGLAKTLPQKHLDWAKRHKLTFDKPFSVSLILSGSASQPAEADRLSVELTDVTMELPPEEGGMKFAQVSGKLVFDAEGVTIERLAGRMGESSSATFSLTGRYHGYGPTSGLDASLQVEGLELPLPADSAKVLNPSLASLLEGFRPAGKVDVSARLSRPESGPLRVDAEIDLRNLTVSVPTGLTRFQSLAMPGRNIPVEGLEGQIVLRGEKVELRGLRGRGEGAALAIDGELARDERGSCGHVRCVGTDLTFEQVRAALPEKLQRKLDIVSPRGRANIAIEWRREASQDHGWSRVEITPGSGASLEYSRFPYRVDWTKGSAEILGGVMYLHSIHGHRGDMRCRIGGRIGLTGADRAYEVLVDATDVPLDDYLAERIPTGVRGDYESCGLSGVADVTQAVLRSAGDGSLEYVIPVTLKDAGIRHRRFDYPITQAAGTLTITPEKVVVERITGRHDRAAITLAGEVSGGQDGRVFKLLAEASELALDGDLRSALWEGARRSWDLVDPSGTADVSLDVALPLDDAAGPATASAPAADVGSGPDVQYRVVVRPRDLSVRYRHFPYRLTNVKGTAELVPGKVVLGKLTGLAGGAKVSLDGEVLTEPGAERGNFVRVLTEPMKVDEELLAALPKGLVEVLGLGPGGTVALDLDALEIRPTEAEAPPPQPDVTVVAARDAALAAAQPAKPLAWRWSGRIAFVGANVDLGLSGRQVTGELKGSMSCDGRIRTLKADAGVQIDSLRMGSGVLSDITGRLVKDAQGPILRVDDISGRGFGGKLAGFAEVQLSEPRRYGVNLSAEDIGLDQFVRAARKDPTQKTNIRGLLTGSLQLTATVGDGASRRATGELHIRDAEMYDLPIVLGLLHVVNLTLPKKGAFNAADVRYILRGDELICQNVYLKGSALSLLGGGRMDLKTRKLSLTFLLGPARKLPSSPILEFLEGLTSQLMTVRVTGSIDNPRIEEFRLRDLGETLREIHQPDVP